MTHNTILTPLVYENFVKKYWETQPLHIERSDSSHFEGLLSEAKIIELVQDGEARFPDVQAINAVKPVSVADYTTNNKSVCPEKMMQCYSQGATIVVSEVHKRFSLLQELCVRFSKDFHLLCQANAYLSPAGNQGFHSHYDTHDVFVLQVAGRKKFRFYNSGIKLPFTDDTYTPENNTDSEIVDEVEVSAGDTLYIPRGIVHDAIADKGEPSLHITLGAFPFVLRDLLQVMVQVAAERDVEWRSSVDLKPDLRPDLRPNLKPDLSSHASDLVQLYERTGSIFTDQVYFEALSRLADEVALEQPTMQPLVGVPAVSEISLQSVVSVDHSRLYGVEELEGVLKLRLSGTVLRFEAPMSDAVSAIITAGSMQVSEVPGLSDDQKQALCQQLAEARAITVAITFGNEA